MARELHIGGSERQMTEAAKHLDRSLFELHVGCFSPAGVRAEELRDCGVSVVHFPVHSYRSTVALREAHRLMRYIRDRRIRIVHTWDYPLNVFAIPISRLTTPAISISSQRSHRSLIPKAFRPLVQLSDRLSHALVVNCEYVRRHLLEQGVAPQKIWVCYNGIDLERFRPVPPAPRGPTVGVVCALRAEKDLGTLIDAFAAVRDLAPDLNLLIVGSGKELGALQLRARQAGLEAACRFEPATADVARWLHTIDIFVLPSRTEALSNSLMEAMACGCCVIASNVGGNPELVRDSETGLLFPPGDVNGLAGALRRVILDPALRARLANAGGCFLRERFSSAKAVDRLAEIYLTLLGRTAG